MVFLFLVIFLGNITLPLFLNKLLRGWVFWDTFSISSHHPSWLLCIGVLFALVWSMRHTSEVVPLIQLSLRRWSLGLFDLSTLLLSLILPNLFLPVELLRHSLYTIAFTMDTTLLNSLVAYLLHWEGLVRLDFLHSLILSLSNSLTPDLTAMLCLTCTLLVKSGTHSLLLFSQLPMTYTPSNAVYQVTSAFNLTRLPSFPLTLVEF